MSGLHLLSLVALLGSPPQADVPSNESIRAAIQRSIPYIEEKGTWWIEEKKCVSCHRVGSMVWSLAAARTNGFAVSDRLGEWLDWSVEKSLATNDMGIVGGSTNKEGVAQLVMALMAADERSAQPRVGQLVQILTEGQQPDGSWQAGGQLPQQKRPATETADVSTMWLATVLASQNSTPATGAAIENAMRRISKSAAGTSTEFHAARLLLALAQHDEQAAKQSADTLRALQQADGGWGWIATDPSDALATGMSLYALSQSGGDRNDPTIARALQFLINAQRDDGSWPVKGTRTAKQDSVEETSVYWGTTWAVLGMIASLQD